MHNEVPHSVSDNEHNKTLNITDPESSNSNMSKLGRTSSILRKKGSGEGTPSKLKSRVSWGSAGDDTPVLSISSIPAHTATSLSDDSGDDAAGERVVPMDVPVTVVEQDLDEHFFGPTYTTRAIIHRDIDEPLGLVLLSALDAAVQGVTGKVSQGTGGQTHPSGTRIGKIKPNSPVAKSNCVHVGDQIVSINGANMMNMRHEEVVTFLAQQTGTIALVLARSQARSPEVVQPAAVTLRGTGPIPAKVVERVRGAESVARIRAGSRRSMSRKSTKRKDLLTVGTSYHITVHRHPNTRGLQIGVKGGMEHDCFPEIVTATHPRSPFFPLVEGGALTNGHELLGVDGRVVVGMSHAAIITMLKEASEEVQLHVVAPGRRRRKVSDLFSSAATSDVETRAYCCKVRRSLYTETVLVTTQLATSAFIYEHASLDGFAKLAANAGLLEWTLHANGYFYGIRSTPQRRIRGPGPAVLPPTLLEILEEQHDASPVSIVNVPATTAVAASVNGSATPSSARQDAHVGGGTPTKAVEHTNGTPASPPKAIETTNGVIFTPPKAVEHTNGTATSPPKAPDATNGTASTPTKAIEATNGVASTPTKAAEATNGSASTPPKAIEATNGVASTPTKAVEATNGSASTPLKAVDATNGTVSTPPQAVEATNGSVSTPSKAAAATNGTASTIPKTIEATNGTASPPPKAAEATNGVASTPTKAEQPSVTSTPTSYKTTIGRISTPYRPAEDTNGSTSPNGPTRILSTPTAQHARHTFPVRTRSSPTGNAVPRMASGASRQGRKVTQL